jgi:DNA-binding NarL/FixJ family response regulator
VQYDIAKDQRYALSCAMMIKVLHIDDDRHHYELTKQQLRRLSSDIDLENTATLEDSLSQLKNAVCCCAICDSDPESGAGVAVFKKLRADGDTTPFIFLSEADLDQGETAGLPGYEDDEFNVVLNYGRFDQVVYWIRRFVDMRSHFLEAERIKTDVYGITPERMEQLKTAIKELTSREREILDLIATGAPNKDIAVELGISYRTVVNHVYSIFSKLGIHSRAEAIHYALSIKIADGR